MADWLTGDVGVKPGVQANQARLLATAEVARLLASADDLKRLPALREDVLAKKEVSLTAPCCVHAVKW